MEPRFVQPCRRCRLPGLQVTSSNTHAPRSMRFTGVAFGTSRRPDAPVAEAGARAAQTCLPRVSGAHSGSQVSVLSIHRAAHAAASTRSSRDEAHVTHCVPRKAPRSRLHLGTPDGAALGAFQTPESPAKRTKMWKGGTEEVADRTLFTA